MEPELLEELDFEYTDYEVQAAGRPPKKRVFYLEENERPSDKRVRTIDGQERDLTWEDLTLKRTIQAGTLVETDDRST